MKFLCTRCDRPMKLRDAMGPDRGSVALIYGCETCDAGFAMLTNPHETQAVTSLGVEIGPATDPGFAAAASKCPFNGMLQEMGVDVAPTATKSAGSPNPGSSGPSSPSPGAVSADVDLVWTDAAKSRLESIPSFVRPMAVDGIESYAREKGYGEIDERVMDEVREHFV